MRSSLLKVTLKLSEAARNSHTVTMSMQTMVRGSTPSPLCWLEYLCIIDAYFDDLCAAYREEIQELYSLGCRM